MTFTEAKKALGIKAFGVPFCPACGPGCSFPDNDGLKLTAKRVIKQIKERCASDAVLGKLRRTDLLADSYENGTVLRFLWGDPWELKGKVVWYETKEWAGNLIITRAILECKNGYALLGAGVPKNTKAIKGGL